MVITQLRCALMNRLAACGSTPSKNNKRRQNLKSKSHIWQKSFNHRFRQCFFLSVVTLLVVFLRLCCLVGFTPWHVDMAVWILIYLFMWKEYIWCTRGLHLLCLVWFGMDSSINSSYYISTGANASLPDVAFLTHGGSSGENPILSDSFNPGHFRLVLGMSPCDIPLQLSMKSFASFHMEPEAEVPPAKPLTALFMPVPLHEVLGECTGPVSLSTPTPLPWQSSLPGLYHLAVTPHVPLLPEVSLHSVLVMNALIVDDQSMVVSLEGFASISRQSGAPSGRLHFSSSSRIGSSSLQSCSACHLPYLRGTFLGLERVLDWSGSSFLQLNIRAVGVASKVS